MKFCTSCLKILKDNENFCTRCGRKLKINSNTSNDISDINSNRTIYNDMNLDKIFEDIDTNILIHLKLNKKLNEYVTLRQKWKKDDALWGIYNKIKFEAEQNYDFSSLSINFNHMFNIVFKEGKYTEALEFMYCSFYCSLYHRMKIDKDFGSTRTRHLRNVLELNRTKFSKTDIEISIQNEIPQFYNQEKIDSLCRMIENSFKKYSR